MKKEIWPSGRFQLLFGMKPERMPQFAWDELCVMRITGKLIMAVMILHAVASYAAYIELFAGTNFELLAERLFSSGVLRAIKCLQVAECYILLAIWSRLRAIVSRAQDCDYRLCEKCGYNLGRLPENHKCPECGVVYEIHAIRTNWQLGATQVLKGHGSTVIFSNRGQWSILVVLAFPLLTAVIVLLKGC